MRYIVDKSNEKSAYLQIYEQLRHDIVEGAYPYGTKMPSKRSLADGIGVSIITIEHAYSLLCDEGYTESRERSGHYVIYRRSDFFAVDYSKEVKETPSPKTAERSRSSFPFSVLSRAMRKVLADYGEAILEKTGAMGCLELRNTIAKYLVRSRGIFAVPSQIVIGSGAEYLYGLVVTMLGRDRIYAIEKPSYEKIEAIYTANGVALDMLTLGKDGIESRELRRTQASVLHISPYRSFPSGVTASATKREEYLHWASAGDKYIIEDDFESEFTLSTKPEQTVFLLADGNRVIYMNTFSMTVTPSIRLGYMVLPRDCVELFDKKAGFYSCPVPVFEQLVIAELIESGDFERHINRVRRQNRKKSK